MPLSLEEAKTILDDESLSDMEVKRIQVALEALAQLVIERLKEERLTKPKTEYHD